MLLLFGSDSGDRIAGIVMLVLFAPGLVALHRWAYPRHCTSVAAGNVRPMTARRHLPTDEARDLIALVREIATKELAPRSAEAEATEVFPRDVFKLLGQAGLLSLPYPEEFGGGDQPYEVYLQVLEEIGAVWSSVGVGVSVHALSCFGLARFGTDEQKAEWLPDMLGGDLLGAYCLSEAHAGSDPAAMRTTARRDGDSYVLNGAKAWTTHGGHADSTR